MKKILTRGTFFVLSLSVTACMPAYRHAEQLPTAHERKITIGLVQRDIHNGMSRDEVAGVLGSPNIVSRDESGVETWIFDKIASESSYSDDAGSGSILGAVFGGGGTIFGGGGGTGYRRQAGAAATSQKTLTVIIKFDPYGRVTSSTYHSSTF